MDAIRTDSTPNGQPTAAPIGSTPQLPTPVIEFRPEGVPQELRDFPHWFGWRYAWRDDIPGNPLTKPPLCVRNGKAQGKGEVDNPRTWAPFPEALKAYAAGGLDGLGIVMSLDMGLIAIDLDHVLDAEGNLLPWAADFILRLPATYTETSPGGSGLRLFLYGTLPPWFLVGVKGGRQCTVETGKLEVYAGSRYLTVTGARCPNAPLAIASEDGRLEAVLSEYWPRLVTHTEVRAPPSCVRSAPALGEAALDDEALLKKMLSDPRKGAGTHAVWVGDDSAFDGDESRADQSLLRELAYWTDKDPARMERLFNQSLRANRLKWQTRADYRNGSIAKAIAITVRTYSGPAQVMTLRGVTHTESERALPLPWGVPHPLTDPALPEFPIQELPFALREFVQAVAVETQTPLALPGMVALGTLAMACARRWRIEIRPGWQQPLGLYVLPCARSGSGKSGVFRRFVRIVHEVQHEEEQRMAPEVRRAQQEQKLLEKRHELKLKEAGKTIATDQRVLAEEEALSLGEKLAGLRIPTPPRYYLDDVTPEKLGMAIEEQGGSIGILSAESIILENIAGRYSDGKANYDLILKGHEGDPYAQDRVGRDPVSVESPALSIALCVQPEVLQQLGGAKGAQGRGLLARFLFALPQDNVGFRDCAAPPVPLSVSAPYEAMLRALLIAAPGPLLHGRHLIEFAPRAQAKMLEFRQALEPRFRPGADLDLIPEWGGKLAGAVGRIAALLQLAANGPNAERGVIEHHVDSAVRMAPFFIAHALAAHRMMGSDPALETAKRVLRWIGEREGFKRREVQQALRSVANPSPESFDPALRLLEEEGWIRLREREHSPDGGRPSIAYDVNPLSKGSPR